MNKDILMRNTEKSVSRNEMISISKNAKNNFKLTRKDESNMSFVGMAICSDGIVAFGDSKSTKMRNEEYREDFYRGHISKVFKHQSFVLSTWGNNEIIVNNYKIEYIEDVIEMLLIQADNHTSFLELFKQYLLESKCILEYSFLIGYFADNHYHVEEYKVNAFFVMSLNHMHHNDYRIAGDSRYFERFRAIDYPDNINCEQYKELILTELPRIIHSFDDELSYNTVGLPIHTQIFQKI